MAQDYTLPGASLRGSAMTKMAAAVLCMLAPAAGLRAEGLATDADAYWPQWRGPNANGVAPQASPPLEWSESRNVRWKVDIPGRGHATPIAWGNCVYIQTAVQTDRKAKPEGPGEEPSPDGPGRRGHNWMGGETPTHVHEFVLMAIDRRTGGIVWQRTLCEVLPHEGGHRDASQASNSPVTDGVHVIAYFGSRGLYCLDMQGKLIWKKDFGKMQTRMGFGEGSSPTLYGDTVIVNWDHEGQSFIIALDKNTGQQRWKVDRDEITSWATPLVVEHDGKPQVVTSATGLIRSYDLRTGGLLWQCGGMTRNVIPTPVCSDSLVYAMSGFRGSALQAIRYPAAEGDVTDSAAVAWKYTGKGTPYVPSPLLYGDTLYFLDTNRAILSCVDPESGRPHYTKQRLEGMEDVFASPVGANNRVYILGRNGTTAVIQRGPEYKLLATNTLDDGFTASPAIVQGEIYLRGHKHLYCIAEE